MTADDQVAAIGRLITRYSDAKKQRAALLSEIAAHAQAVEAAAKVLASVNFNTAFADGRTDGYTRTSKPARVQPYLDAARANELLADLETVSRELRDLRTLVKDAGLSVD